MNSFFVIRRTLFLCCFTVFGRISFIGRCIFGFCSKRYRRRRRLFGKLFHRKCPLGKFVIISSLKVFVDSEFFAFKPVALEQASQYTVADIYPCMKLVLVAFKQAPDLQVQAVCDKYKENKSEFFCKFAFF